jgi:hypothetical protein
MGHAMNTDVIARARFEYVVPGRPARDIQIVISRPYQTTSGEWACPAAIQGLHPELATMHGEDAFQALALALHLVRQLLEAAISQGASFRYPGSSDDVPLEAYFPAVAVLDD